MPGKLGRPWQLQNIASSPATAIAALCPSTSPLLTLRTVTQQPLALIASTPHTDPWYQAFSRVGVYTVNRATRAAPSPSWTHRFLTTLNTGQVLSPPTTYSCGDSSKSRIFGSLRVYNSSGNNGNRSSIGTSWKAPGVSRQLSTKPTMPRLQEQQSSSSYLGPMPIFADLDNGTNPATTLQKSLAAVEHYALKNEMRLRITEVDAKGVLKIKAGEFLKSDLCQQHGLHPRDLRKIDSGFSNHMPVVLVRPEVILINLGHIRALITADLVILFDSPDSKDRVEDSPFVKDLQEKLKMNTVDARGQPFEFRAMEAIFLSVVASLHAEMDVLVHYVLKLLTDLENQIDQNKLKELLQYTKKVSRFESRALLVRNVFEELLDQDEDLAALYLTEKKEGHPRPVDSHDEAEILLEAYMKQTEEIVNIVALVKHSMQSTEDFVNIFLSAKRTQLLLFELRLAMGMLGISSSALIAGLYGMNLHNYLEHDAHAFFVVSATAAMIGGTVFMTCARKLRVLAKGTA